MIQRVLIFTFCLFGIVLPDNPSVAGPSISEPDPAGSEVESDTAPEFHDYGSPWHFEFRPYLWTASLKGDVGINGIVAPMDVGFDDILDNLDFAWAQTIEAYHEPSRFGMILDFSYIKMSPSIEPVEAPLFSTIGVNLEMILFDAAVTYRLLEWERGFLELMAGMRYTNLDMGMRISPDSQGISSLSRDLAANATQQIGNQIQGTVQRQVAAISSQVRSGIQSQIQEGVQGPIPPDFPDLPDGPIRDRIQDLVEARVAEQVAQAEAAASAKVSAAQAKALDQARKASGKAEKSLAKQIEKSLDDKLPREVGGSEAWWDPHVGIRLKHHLNDRLYVAGLFDVGGFGVGSDLAIHAGGGIGYEVSEGFSIEVLYRYLKTDYENGGFLYDTEMSGIFVGGAFSFGAGDRVPPSSVSLLK